MAKRKHISRTPPTLKILAQIAKQKHIYEGFHFFFFFNM